MVENRIINERRLDAREDQGIGRIIPVHVYITTNYHRGSITVRWYISISSVH